MASLQKLYFMTLTNFLKLKNVKLNISEMARASAKMGSKTCVDLDICQQMTLLQKLFPTTFTYFLKQKDLKILVSQTVKASVKM